MVLAGHGIGTAILGRGAIQKAIPIVIIFPKNCWKNGNGVSDIPSKMKSCVTLIIAQIHWI